MRLGVPDRPPIRHAEEALDAWSGRQVASESGKRDPGAGQRPQNESAAPPLPPPRAAQPPLLSSLPFHSQVVDVIRTGQCTPPEAADALAGRLAQKNPHKVWLAVELTRACLTGAPGPMARVRGRVLGELERVAALPMNRGGGGDLKAQQAAKTAAFALVNELTGGAAGAGAAGGAAGASAPAQSPARAPSPAPAGAAAAAAADGAAAAATTTSGRPPPSPPCAR